MPKLAALAIAVAALASPAGAGEPLGEAAYDAAVQEWYGAWKERAPAHTDRRERCIQDWQLADGIRTRVVAVQPPPSRADYHAALVAFLDAYLRMTDRCVGDVGITPEWMADLKATAERKRAIRAAARASRLNLPATW